ncbi:Cro/C1-type helix-turn-helix DNA-binding protein [Kineothrix alysoides]|uniref:Cro/C1-type helix-turn-helix DNA-binding protein n=2 Tax=Kineothrix alysoides TaxID=1469948 RepID=A0A4R1QUI1_9FIRM|nr:helix-turn-helix transcriptional regulator [Kineothrix alysoides]TCL57616.1 Cro/C1-type helix-turn-helix DNA-binding protein [Kineothrix alysoides]
MDAKLRIKQLMDDRGWSDYRLSQEAGLSQSTISNIFKRNNAPTIPTLEAICNAFGITLAQFFSADKTPIELTEEQWKLFKKWNELSDEKKKVLFDLMNIM